LNYILSFDTSSIFVVKIPIIYEIFDQITCREPVEGSFTAS